MFRSAFIAAKNQVGRCTGMKNCLAPIRANAIRSYGKERSKLVPTFFRRRDPFDDFFRYPVPRIFEQQMKSMQRIMDEMMTAQPRVFVSQRNENETEIKYDKKEFGIKIDVSNYSPEDLNVKVLDDTIVITGKHQEKVDEHGTISREFTRKFLIPENVEVDTIESVITDDGKLIVSAKVKGGDQVQERTIDIKKVKGDGKGDGSKTENQS